MSKQKYALLVVAHPDDESIFFSGLLMNQRSMPWKVVCVTDGNADQMGSERAQQFKKACALLKAKSEHWDFQDKFEERLDVERLVHRLSQLDQPAAVYTHGILGEYGHPHHQDVAYAAHRAFAKKIPVWSVAYNAFPKKRIQLTTSQFKLKSKIITKVYHSETLRFLNFLPITSSEGFLKMPLTEVEHLYSYFTGKSDLQKARLIVFSHLYDYLKERRALLQTRPF